MRRHREGFTLIELLVVIGIIGVLLAILLPALSRARQQANTIACGSNLHNIGVGMNNYISEYRGYFPPSNYYKGMLKYDPILIQLPDKPYNGYVHWSSFLYTDKVDAAGPNVNPDTYFMQNKGWDMFQCPSLTNGGLPPANTFPSNSDGLPNEAQPADGSTAYDWQAPRLSYTVNEILCPRGIFYKGFRGALRPYKFVPASRVRQPSNVILASELWGTQALSETPSIFDNTIEVSNSRRPVNDVSIGRTTGLSAAGITPDQMYLVPYTTNFVFASVSELAPDPTTSMGSVANGLNEIGRNHGDYKHGSLTADTLHRTNWDLRQTNFLYVDGHVETKHITDTLSPVNQWGTDFYTLDP